MLVLCTKIPTNIQVEQTYFLFSLRIILNNLYKPNIDHMCNQYTKYKYTNDYNNKSIKTTNM